MHGDVCFEGPSEASRPVDGPLHAPAWACRLFRSAAVRAALCAHAPKVRLLGPASLFSRSPLLRVAVSGSSDPSWRASSRLPFFWKLRSFAPVPYRAGSSQAILYKSSSFFRGMVFHNGFLSGCGSARDRVACSDTDGRFRHGGEVSRSVQFYKRIWLWQRPI